jgi:hypothetical protein
MSMYIRSSYLLRMYSYCPAEEERQTEQRRHGQGLNSEQIFNPFVLNPQM